MQVQVETGVAGACRVLLLRPGALHPHRGIAVVAAVGGRLGAERPLRQRPRLDVAPAQRRARTGQTALAAHHQPLLLRERARRADFDLHRWPLRPPQQDQQVIIGIAEGPHPIAHAGHLRLAVPIQEQADVDDVRAGVVHRTAAVALQGLPIPAPSERMIGDARLHDAPQHPGRDHLAYLHHVAVIAVVLEHGEQPAGGRGRRGHVGGRRQVGSHRLFADHVLAGAQRGDGVLGVQVARRRHYYHLHARVGEQRRELAVRGAAEPLLRFRPPRRQRIGHRGDAVVGAQPVQQPRVNLPAAASQPGDPNPNFRSHR